MALFEKAIAIDAGDGVEFEIGRTSVLEHEHGEHQRLRVHIIGKVGKVGKCSGNTYADVGIGAEAPVNVRELPIITMVQGQSSATIRVQPFSYTMAEKLHSIIVRGLSNTRMKDNRDLVILSRKGFDDETVREAIAHTFAQRHTDIPEMTPEGLLPVFSEARQQGWQRYLEKKRITGMPADLGSVVEELRQYFDDKLTPSQFGCLPLRLTINDGGLIRNPDPAAIIPVPQLVRQLDDEQLIDIGVREAFRLLLGNEVRDQGFDLAEAPS